jgi:peptidoglycan/xylan/chitin deacetylase (PgdA/CDA1 family)
VLNYEWINKIVIAIAIVVGIIIVSLNPLQMIDQFNFKQNLAGIESKICTNSNIHTDYSKVVILTFDDSRKSQYTYAAPIMDKCGFKATFFTVYNYLGQDNSRMTWDDITILQKNGHDIESHTMNHPDLTKMSLSGLYYEIGGSKKGFADHHIITTVFASPHGNIWNNKTVIDIVSKYYSFGRDGYSPTMFLHCDGWRPFTNQPDCRTYSMDGKLNFANRYSIRAWDHNYYDILYSHDTKKIFPVFVNEVNQGKDLNKYGTSPEIPVIAYHNVDFKSTDYDTNVNLFADEMNYLYQNGFRVVTMADLGYDENSNTLYIKNK